MAVLVWGTAVLSVLTFLFCCWQIVLGAGWLALALTLAVGVTLSVILYFSPEIVQWLRRHRP
jgi:hypothetical protein